MPECRCWTEAAEYQKKCRRRTNFSPAFRHLHTIFQYNIARITPSWYIQGISISAGHIPFHRQQNGCAGCIHFRSQQYGRAGIPFYHTAVWSRRMYPFPEPAKWTCRMYSFPPNSSMDVQGVSISAASSMYVQGIFLFYIYQQQYTVKKSYLLL